MSLRKGLAIGLILLFIVTSGIPIAIAEEPALLKTTIIGGFGLTVKVKNVGNMTATNITYNCLVTGNLTHRNKTILRKLIDITPNEEIILHHIFFFIGNIMVGAGPLSYFDGEEFRYFFTNIHYAFCVGPFVKLLISNQ